MRRWARPGRDRRRPDRACLLVQCLGGLVLIASASGAGAATSPVLITEPAQGLSALYALIGTARSSLDMTMYELVDATAQQDLCAAASRGVRVRVILDINRERAANTPAFTQLQACGVGTVWAATSFAAMHEKSIVVDAATPQARAAIMTLNLTARYYATTRDFAVIDANPADVAAIETTFDADYAHTAIVPPEGADLVWSPTDAMPKLLALIGSARHTLLIENEEMADTTIVTALRQAAGRGVDVTVVMTNSANTYAQQFDALKAGGVRIGTYPDSDTALYIHAKVIVADAGSVGQQAFVGSQNFSGPSLTSNRELGLVLTDAPVVASLAQIVGKDYQDSTPW